MSALPSQLPLSGWVRWIVRLVGAGLPLASAVGALVQLGTVGALVLSVRSGLFGFTETLEAPLLGWSIGVESAGFVVLAACTWLEGRPLLATAHARPSQRH